MGYWDSILTALICCQNRTFYYFKLYWMKVVVLLLAIIVLSASTSSTTNHIWPKPSFFSCEPSGERLKVNPCDIQFVVDSAQSDEVNQILKWYLTKVFNCGVLKAQSKVTLNIIVQDGSILVPTDVNHEAYSLQLGKNKQWILNADFYPGFLRGLQTFSQLFERDIDEENYVIVGLPISIKDQPTYKWRGLMIDTARHFLPVPTILRAIDSMLYSKLNILHWHIVDEDAFPMEVPNVPELSQFGKIGGVFTPEDIKTVIDYARIRGIRVIPEIDSPAHTQSWGRSQKYKDITLTCNGIYMGQFDPSLNLTWDVVTEVMKYINTTFEDDFVHFGGDQVTPDCWGARQSLLDWMAEKNIPDYEALQVYYREHQKQIWRTISPKKRVIYWANEDVDLPVQDDDIIHWWGISANVKQILGRKNEIILSNKDQTYLDYGFNNMYGNVYGIYCDWRRMYGYEPRLQNVNVIGGETCMWDEAGNRHTFDQKVVQRSSVLGQRLWNVNVDLNTEINNIATRLTAHTERLRQRGYKVWPVTVELCEKDMSNCF